jgi:pimeloyl-ACP methyl ester carboxylesterase
MLSKIATSSSLVTHLDTESAEETDETMTTQLKNPELLEKERTMKEPEDGSRRRFLKASSMLGLAVAFSPGTMIEAFAGSKSGINEENNMTQNSATQPASEQVSDKTAIRPFQFNFTDAELTDLRRRINATKWPERELVTDASQGVQLATMQKLARYWGTDYDWHKGEAKLKAVPQFITEIDGLDIHFIHVRSKHENALPMIVTHGWPGSIIEQMKIIDPLTDPTAHGGTAEDAFHLVIPSLPGYGFSGKPTKPGWNPVSIAKAWATLMQRLGYTKYVAQGGDWGNAVSEVMALQQPPGLLGIHTNMAATVPPDVSKALSAGGPPPASLSPEEKYAWDGIADFYKNGLGYANEMALRPQTLYGIVDSPIGLASWILDHNITLYWLTNTAISSARLYWDTSHNLPAGGFFDTRGVKLPVAVSAFAEEIYQAPKSWTEKAYPKLIHYNRLPKGGHFAAWEQPEYFVTEMRAAFRTLR